MICPRCSEEYHEYPALSRKDNLTNICPDCGTEEAFEDAELVPPYRGHAYWSYSHGDRT